VALMVPITALLVPKFVMFKYLGMINTYWPLIAPALIGTMFLVTLLIVLIQWRIVRRWRHAFVV
jgi:multiple sugar transport system permease protein